MCTFCVLVKTGTLFSYTNVRIVIGVKQQAKVYVIHTNTARDPCLRHVYLERHRKLEIFPKNYFINKVYVSVKFQTLITQTDKKCGI